MAWPVRGSTALLVASLALVVACKGGEPPAPGDGAAPSTKAAPGGLPGTETLVATTPHVQAAIDTANDLFQGRYEAVTARLEPSLRDQLSPSALNDLVAGVVGAHGQPERATDAWAGTVREDEQALPTASVLLRMSRSPVRFRLLLVFNPDNSLRGLWLRPI